MPRSASSVPGLMWPGSISPGTPESTPAPSQTLILAQDVTDAAGLDITAQLAPPASTVLQFSSSMRERLYVQVSVAGVTVQVAVSATVLGQPVNNFTPVILTSGHLYMFGRFHSVIDIPGTSTVTVTLSTVNGVQIALVQEAI